MQSGEKNRLYKPGTNAPIRGDYDGQPLGRYGLCGNPGTNAPIRGDYDLMKNGIFSNTTNTRNERPDQRGLRHILTFNPNLFSPFPERTPRSEGITTAPGAPDPTHELSPERTLRSEGITTDEVYHGHVSQKYPERTHRSEGIEDLRAKPLGKKAPKVGMKVLIKED